MKKIIFYLFILSVTIFSCRSIKNPTDPYIKKNNKVYYQKGEGGLSELKGADSKTFKTISIAVSSCEIGEYGKDRNNVYFKNIQMTDADAASFEELGQGYYKDKKYIYFHGKKLEDSDSQKEIEIIDGSKDKNCVPWGDGGCILNNGHKYLNGGKI